MKEINRREFLGSVGAAAFSVAWASSRVAEAAKRSRRTLTRRALPAFDLPHLRVSSLEGTHAYPDAAAAPGGVTWITYVTTYMAGDFIAARSFDGKALSGHLKVSEATGVECQPAVCSAGKDAAWIAWSARRGGKWLVLARRVEGGRMSREHVVGEGGQCNWTPAVAPTSEGGVWVAWQRHDGKRKSIFARRFESGKWEREVLISAVDDVLAVRLGADKPGKLNAKVRLTRAKDMKVTAVDGHRLHMDGQIVDVAAPEGPEDNPGGSGPGGPHMRFAGRLLVRTAGGTVEADADAPVSYTHLTLPTN